MKTEQGGQPSGPAHLRLQDGRHLPRRRPGHGQTGPAAAGVPAAGHLILRQKKQWFQAAEPVSTWGPGCGAWNK